MSINLTQGLTEPTEASSDPLKSGPANDDSPAPATGTDDTEEDSSGTSSTMQHSGPPPYEIRNCTGDHVIVSAGPRYFRLSPLGTTDGDERKIETFALRDLADRHIVGLLHRDEAPGATESGLVFGLGFWLVFGYFIGLSNIEAQPARMIFAIGTPIAVMVGGVIVLAVLKKRLADVGHGLSLILVFILGAGIPVGVAIAFGDLPGLIRDGPSAELFGRLTQTLLIMIAALIPTLLYFIFDRQRVNTIRHNFQHQILRLDPTLHTLYDVDAKYGDLLIEAVGRDGVRGARINRTNPYPIFLAGVLLVLGWLLVLPVVDNSQELADPATVASYLQPRQTTYVFGFLGAYFFALNLIARRYVRGDLRPKAYGTISVRILTVVILSWVLEIAFDPDEWLYVAAFLVGIVPETFFTLVAEGRRAFLGWFSDALREPHPLTSLEGIDLYDRSRLQDEGVNNVEALAHHDLVELMLATRIPVPRLVDWVDQAILYLHTVDERGKGFGREHLRRCGIRTASDLIAAHDKPQLWTALIAGDDAATTGRLDLVHAAIGDDEWMVNVLEWRTAAGPGDRSFHVVDGRAVLDC